jgi:RNA polymerase sigma-70 factor (ECF subfamily)
MDERPSDASFPVIFNEYAPFVLRTMRHLGVSPADLEDQCQEVFVALFQGLSGFGGRSALRTWVYGICRYTASNYRRRAYIRRERAVSEVPEQPAALAPQEQDLLVRTGCLELERLLSVLDDDKREVFVLYELEELSMKDVAAVCQCPVQTGYSRLHAARKLLREAYERRQRER